MSAASQVVIPLKSGDRVLYQRVVPVTSGSAYVHIDDGYISALRARGFDVSEWCDDDSVAFDKALEAASPSLFLGVLQRSNRIPASWTGSRMIDLLATMKQRGMVVAAQSCPSDMPDVASELVAELGIDFDVFPQAGVRSYYTQERRPLPAERRAIDAGVIDLIRTPLAREVIPRLFRSFLELGLPVYQELFACDVHRYPLGGSNPASQARDVGVSYVGGCWPFKWHAMRPYVEAVRARFGERFALHGRGWPNGISRGPLPDDRAYVDLAMRSKVCLSLHEPSQLTRTPFAINERPFKLAALGACVVSDPNPMLMELFEPGTEMVFAESPEQMAGLVDGLIRDGDRCAAIGRAARERIRSEHTYDHRIDSLLESIAGGIEPGESTSCLDHSQQEPHCAA